MDDRNTASFEKHVTSRAAALTNPDLPIVTRIELAMALRETLLEYVQDQTKTLISTLITAANEEN